MPLPFISIAVGALGVGGYLDAKDKNEEAQKIIDKAKASYNSQKLLLETRQTQAELACKILGMQKKMTMETSVRRFRNAYDKIKDFRWETSVGLDEIGVFAISQQEMMEFCELSHVYQSLFSNVETGAAISTAIFLALGGSPLGAVAGGSFGMLGTSGILGIGGTTSSALALTTAIPALSVVAAPTLFVTGISASIKADENLEKAQSEKAKAERAVEQMKNSEILCQGIVQRAEMFNDLLVKLDGIFEKCTRELDETVRQKTVPFQQKIDMAKLTKKDLKLIAVTRSLAGAIKSVIDMPILNQSEMLSEESKNQHDKIKKVIPEFERQANSVL